MIAHYIQASVCCVHASMYAISMRSHAYICVLCACIGTQGLRTVHSDECFPCSNHCRKTSDMFVHQSLARSDRVNYLHPALGLCQADTYFSQHPRRKPYRSPWFTAKQTAAQKG